LLPESSGALCVTASSRNVVEVVSTWGEPSIAEQVFKPQDCWGLRRGKVHASDNGSASLRCSHLSAELPRHTLCVPMMAHGETLGLLYVDTGRNGNHAQGEGDFAASEQLARSLAEQASLALANLRLREVLRVQSVRDPLTNLYNRRYFEESLQRELARAARKQTPVGLMMLDIDHFKRFNDQYGHDAGDAVLRSFAHMLHSQLRAEDVVCRYGGEEFAVVMPEAPVEACLLRAEQLGVVTRKVIAQLRGQPLEPISISIGVACYPMNGDTGEALLKAADAALYRAKAEGRDRVVAV
jgi:diguanylate cyclase (GGDEF)-like protein